MQNVIALKHSRGWWCLAAVCAAALLFSFVRTVQAGVTQGSERHVQTRLAADAMGRCNTIAVQRTRSDCQMAAR